MLSWSGYLEFPLFRTDFFPSNLRSVRPCFFSNLRPNAIINYNRFAGYLSNVWNLFCPLFSKTVTLCDQSTKRFKVKMLNSCQSKRKTTRKTNYNLTFLRHLLLKTLISYPMCVGLLKRIQLVFAIFQRCSTVLKNTSIFSFITKLSSIQCNTNRSRTNKLGIGQSLFTFLAH